MKNNSYYTEEEKKQRFNIEDFDGIVKELEKQCDESNLQFQEDWVHIDTEIGVATVQNEYGRILASIHF